MSSVLLIRGKRRGEGLVKTEAESGVTQPQAKENPLEKTRKNSPIEPSEDYGPPDTSVVDF